MANTNTPRTFRILISARACENFGRVSYTLTETITAIADGVRVDTHASGIAEGERVDQRSTETYPGVTFEAACSYRLTHGYSEVV